MKNEKLEMKKGRPERQKEILNIECLPAVPRLVGAAEALGACAIASAPEHGGASVSEGGSNAQCRSENRSRKSEGKNSEIYDDLYAFMPLCLYALPSALLPRCLRLSPNKKDQLIQLVS
jgi:hypothetical protein